MLLRRRRVVAATQRHCYRYDVQIGYALRRFTGRRDDEMRDVGHAMLYVSVE